MTDYFVKPDGDDALNGLSHAAAWRTLARVKKGPAGSNDPYSAGDTINIDEGVYREDLSLPPGSSGTSSGPISVRKYGGAAARPRINGADLAEGFVAGQGDRENKLQNAGFEAWSNGAPIGYKATEAGGTISKESIEVYRGQYSVRFNLTSQNLLTLHNTLDITLRYGAGYKLKIAHKDHPDASIIGVYISRGVVGSGAEYLQEDGTWSNKLTARWFQQRTSWTEEVLWFDTGDVLGADHRGQYRIQFAVFAAKPGPNNIIYMDDVRLEEAGRDSGAVLDGDLEIWPTDTSLAHWKQSRAGASTINREVEGQRSGAACVRFDIDAGGNLAAIHQEGFELEDNAKYRFTCWHREPDALNTQQVYLARSDGIQEGPGNWEYLQADRKTWGPSVHGHVFSTITGYMDWHCFTLDFETDAAGPKKYYRVEIGPYYSGQQDGKSFFIDGITLGKRLVTRQSENPDPLLSSWADEFTINPANYTSFAGGSAGVFRSDDRRLGAFSAGLLMGDPGDDCGIATKPLALEGNRTYRLGVVHREEENAASFQAALAVRIRRLVASGPDQFFRNGEWTTEEDDTDYWHEPEWALGTVEFTTPDAGADLNFEVILHPRAGTFSRWERMFIDSLTLERKEGEAAYITAFPAAPSMVFFTGKTDRIEEDHLQLLYEDGGGDPHLYCYSYDDANKRLKINLGEDPTGTILEGTVRDHAFHAGEESFIELVDLVAENQWLYGYHLGFGISIRPSGNKAFRCDSSYSGHFGLIAGWWTKPKEGWSAAQYASNLYQKKTPSDPVIEACRVFKYNRSFSVRVKADSGEWFKGWGSGGAGIAITPGEDRNLHHGDQVGDVRIQYCTVESDLPLLNYSAGRNGINVTVGNTVLIEYCEVSGAEHGIMLSGAFHDGDIRGYTIRYNFSHHNGDDACAVWGVAAQGTICYNLFVWSGDNGLDLFDTVAAEVYGNTFACCVNEMIILWGSQATNPVSAWIFNNIFYMWGDTWRKSNPGIALGAAIGFGSGAGAGQGYDLSRAFVDYNIYHADPGQPTYSKPFHEDRNQLTWTEWQSLGFDIDSMLADPKLVDPDHDDYRPKPDSPCIDGGLDLTKLEAVIDFSEIIPGTYYYFPKETVNKDLIAPESYWPDGVIHVSQEAVGDPGLWEIGCFAYIPGEGPLL